MYRVHIEIQTETNICIYVYREICGSMQREIGMHVGYMYRDSYTCKENLFLESAIYIYMNRGITGEGWIWIYIQRENEIQGVGIWIWREIEIYGK